jgi:post-segregation antitoxin (ccd killing protein)
MNVGYKLDAPKKAVNLSLKADLLRLGKELKLNVSSLAEEALAKAVRACLAEAWLAEHADAIQGYNEHVAKGGLFSDGLRGF